MRKCEARIIRDEDEPDINDDSFLVESIDNLRNEGFSPGDDVMVILKSDFQKIVNAT